jgi:membrane-associated PAP2 superfamily phosphatase
MEASGTPTPPPESPQAPPPATGTGEERTPGPWRALGVVLALALAFASAVMIIAMADIGDTPRCDDPAALEQERQETGDLVIECFEGSQTQKTVSLGLGWPSGVIAGLAALLALYFAATGRRGRLLLQLTAAAIVLGGLSLLIGSL